MSKHTCKRKERFSDLEAACIAARHIRKKYGLSRNDKIYSVYICDVCYFPHVGATLTDEQREDRRTLAQRWADVRNLLERARNDQ